MAQTDKPLCHELRVVDVRASWRILYRLERDAVVILAVFGKTTRTTPKRVIEQAQHRLARYVAALKE